MCASSWKKGIELFSFLFHREFEFKKLDCVNSSLLFDEIFSVISHHEAAYRIFLEALEGEFLSDRLPVVPPSIMQQFISHYNDCGYFDRLEECIGHIDVSCLDLHQVLTLSQNQGLYHAYLYVYTRAMNDYVTPMEDLMKTLQIAVALGKHIHFHLNLTQF